MAYEYVNQYYRINVKPGARVRTKTLVPKEGVVVRNGYDQYVYVQFDGTKINVPVHPMDLLFLSGGKT